MENRTECKKYFNTAQFMGLYVEVKGPQIELHDFRYLRGRSQTVEKSENE